MIHDIKSFFKDMQSEGAIGYLFLTVITSLTIVAIATIINLIIHIINH